MGQIVSASKVKIITKPSLSKTLKSLEIGKPTLFQTSQFKTQQARVCATELKKDKGFEFTITEDGMVNEYIVTRLK